MKVIFACVHNAGRSQMAAAFFNKYADRTKAQATSAGTQPASQVHQCVVKAMEEVGLDLSTIKPQLLTEELTHGADLLVTMGCGEACPHIPNLKGEDWPLSDPKGKSIDEVRILREEISTRVIGLLSSKSLLKERVGVKTE